jgi:hypothetical protein
MFGRGALVLTASAFNLFSWTLSLALMLLGFCSAVKRTTERATERAIARRKARLELRRARYVAMTARNAASPA